MGAARPLLHEQINLGHIKPQGRGQSFEFGTEDPWVQSGSAIHWVCDLEQLTFPLWASMSSSVQQKEWVMITKHFPGSKIPYV